MAEPALTALETTLYPVLERIHTTPGRVGKAELQGTEPDALKLAREKRLVSSSPWRGWFLTDRGAAFFVEIREKAGAQ
jgi:hypothetical protein